MSDLEKIKIDILRDSLKDAIDTIRALDKKIIFLVSYNAIFLGIILKVFLEYKDIKEIFQSSTIYFYSILGIIGLFWVYYFIQMMIGISPKSNPIDIFKREDDKQFANNTFFIFTGGIANMINLDDLRIAYSKIDNYQKLERLLYKEITKVSYIRDMKQNKINESINVSWVLTSMFIVTITFFLLNIMLD